MLTPLTPNQQTRIVNNVVKAVKNINALNSTGYKFIMVASGFIAHYNLYGFIEHYTYNDLQTDIIANQNANRWSNFRPGDQNYDYYMSKAEVYQRIVQALSK